MVLQIEESQVDITEDRIETRRREKEAANKIQERKHDDWNDNYELYRNKVKTNRLTQRQAVNIPLMKETIKTLLSKIDDSPNIDWKELSSDEQKELFFQEVWDSNFKENKLELVDILDKKNVLLYGIGVKKLNIADTGISVDAMDIYDVTFDPLMKASEVETARFVVHQNIFRSVREILADERYTDEGKEQLKMWVNSDPGILQSDKNRKQWRAKIQRLKDMGVQDSDFAHFAGGDRIVNLTEHYYTEWNVDKQDWERRVTVYADDSVELFDETLEELIGVDFWPFVVWSEDPETNDVYPDAVADLVRTPNKVLNVWFSQLIENRTLKNFQMHWFLPGQNYSPQTYTPGPGVMLPAPPGDDINKVIKPVEISGLDDTLNAIAAVTQIVERGTGATAIDKGQAEQGTQTLGEVEILVGKSVERAVGMAKMYRMAWYETAWKWERMLHKNAPKVISLYKVGRSGKMYTKKLLRADWMSKEGYEPIVASTSEQESSNVQSVQKLTFLLQQFPNNTELKKIAQSRMLELADFTPEELRRVLNAEEESQRVQEQQRLRAETQAVAQPQEAAQAPAPQPNEDEALISDIGGLLQQIG